MTRDSIRCKVGDILAILSDEDLRHMANISAKHLVGTPLSLLADENATPFDINIRGLYTSIYNILRPYDHTLRPHMAGMQHPCHTAAYILTSYCLHQYADTMDHSAYDSLIWEAVETT